VTNTNNTFGNKAVTFTNGNKTYVVTGNSPDSLRIGDRFAKTYKHDILVKFALRLGIHANAKVTIQGLCKLIFDVMRAKRPKTPVPTPNAPVNKNALMQRALRKLRMTNELIKNDIRAMYGKNNVPMLNWRAKNMHGIINGAFVRNGGYGKVVMGKGGMPKRSSIQNIKQKLVNRWKSQDANRPPAKNVNAAVLAAQKNFHNRRAAINAARARLAKSPPKAVRPKNVNQEEL